MEKTKPRRGDRHIELHRSVAPTGAKNDTEPRNAQLQNAPPSASASTAHKNALAGASGLYLRHFMPRDSDSFNTNYGRSAAS